MNNMCFPDCRVSFAFQCNRDKLSTEEAVPPWCFKIHKKGTTSSAFASLFYAPRLMFSAFAIITVCLNLYMYVYFRNAYVLFISILFKSLAKL